MAVNTELIRLLLEVEGGAGVERIRDALSLTELAMLDLTQRFATGSVGLEEYGRDAAALGKVQSDLAAKMNALQAGLAAAALAASKATYEFDDLGYELAEDVKWAKLFDDELEDVERGLNATATASKRAERGLDDVGKASTKAGGAAGGLSRAALEGSRAFEDWTTGGFLGLLNNIPGIFSGIGAAAGLSGVAIASATAGISVLATVGFLAWKNWDGLKAAMGTGVVETEAKEMERLAKATERTADEEERLQTLKDNKRIDELKGQTQLSAEEMAKKSGKALEQSVTDAGGFDAVVSSMVEGQTKYAKSTGTIAKGDAAGEAKFRLAMRDTIKRELEAAIKTGDTKGAQGLARGADDGFGSASNLFDLAASNNDPRQRAAEALETGKQALAGRRENARQKEAKARAKKVSQRNADVAASEVEREDREAAQAGAADVAQIRGSIRDENAAGAANLGQAREREQVRASLEKIADTQGGFLKSNEDRDLFMNAMYARLAGQTRQQRSQASRNESPMPYYPGQF
jgi:hypothetical protein